MDPHPPPPPVPPNLQPKKNASSAFRLGARAKERIRQAAEAERIRQAAEAAMEARASEPDAQVTAHVENMELAEKIGRQLGIGLTKKLGGVGTVGGFRYQVEVLRDHGREGFDVTVIDRAPRWGASTQRNTATGIVTSATPWIESVLVSAPAQAPTVSFWVDDDEVNAHTHSVKEVDEWMVVLAARVRELQEEAGGDEAEAAARRDAERREQEERRAIESILGEAGG